MGIEAVIFDLDGVLVDSLSLRLEGLKYTITRFRKSVPDDSALLKLLCFGPKNALAETVGSQAGAYRAFEGFCRAKASEFIVHFSGTTKMLEGLQHLLVKTGLVTSRNRKDSERWLSIAGLDAEFDVVVTYSDVRRAKPNPASLMRAVAAFHLDPAECLYVGDTYDDCEAARRAGMVSALAAWGSPDPEFVEEVGSPNVTFATQTELIAWIERHRGGPS